MTWELLRQRRLFALRRRGRFLAAELLAPHRVLSTSACHGGQAAHVRFLLNHQSCEGRGHDERFRTITESGEAAYHELACREAELPPDDTAIMGTAANMSYVAVVAHEDDEMEVTAVVTAGVESNATCGGDPATWRQEGGAFEKASPHAGTINTMLLVNVPLTPGAHARAVVTMTEGKSAALQRLAVPSRQSQDLATGTGTDQYCVAAPIDGPLIWSSTSPHSKLGELIGRAARDATLEALRWQNGLESSYTRGLCHALGRYGIVEQTFLADMTPLLMAPELELLAKNSKAVLYEPSVGAAAHALAAVLDRIRHGTLPQAIARDACVQQAAILAANLAAAPERWPVYRSALHTSAADGPKALILAAVALGWSDKWRLA